MRKETLTEAVEKHSQKLSTCTRAGSASWSSAPCTQLQGTEQLLKRLCGFEALWQPKGT